MNTKWYLAFAIIIEILVLAAAGIFMGQWGFLAVLLGSAGIGYFVFRKVKKLIKKDEQKIESEIDSKLNELQILISEQKKSTKYREEVINGRERESSHTYSKSNNLRREEESRESGTTSTETSTGTTNTGTEHGDSEGILEVSPEGTDEGQSNLQDRNIESNESTDTSDSGNERDSEEDWADFS